MNKKTVLLLLVVLAVLAGVGRSILDDRSSNVPVGTDVMGTLIFKELPANEITSILIERPGDSVMLMKDKTGWIVQNRFGYPADFSKITDLIRKLKQTKVGRKFPASESVLKRLSLMPPTDTPTDNVAAEEDKATRIRMKDKGETVVADILLGSTRKREEKGVPDSQFVMLAEGADIYLVDQIFSSFETSAPSWLKKSPIKATVEDIQKITCVGPDRTLRYTFARPEKGKAFVLVGSPTQGKIKDSALNRLAGALNGLEIEDVADPSNPPESLSTGISPRLDYTFFNGVTYHVFTGITCSPGIPCYLRLQVDYDVPSAQKAAEAPKTAPEKKETTTGENQGAWVVKAKELNGRLSPWVFIVPEWQHQAFFIALDEILEKKNDVPAK